MSLLKNLKSAVFEEDPAPTANQAVPQDRSIPNPIPFVAGVAATSAVPIADNATLRAKIAQPGSPAVLFAAALQSLSAFIPDEASRFKAAQLTLAPQGVTPSAIASDISVILGRVDAECHNFEAAKAQKQASDVNGPALRLTEIDRQIATLQQERTSVAAAVESAKDAIARKEAEFYATVNALKSEFTANLNKIQLYLGATK